MVNFDAGECLVVRLLVQDKLDQVRTWARDEMEAREAGEGRLVDAWVENAAVEVRRWETILAKLEAAQYA